jgi:hypothetical protein
MGGVYVYGHVLEPSRAAGWETGSPSLPPSLSLPSSISLSPFLQPPPPSLSLQDEGIVNFDSRRRMFSALALWVLNRSGNAKKEWLPKKLRKTAQQTSAMVHP